MKSSLSIILFIVLGFVGFAPALSAQEELSLSKKMATGVAEFRKDLIERRIQYNERVKAILVSIDSSDLDSKKKTNLIEYIKQDYAEGGPSNDLDLFYLLPKNYPLRSPFIESYISYNEDYGVDRALINDLESLGIFEATDALKTQDLSELLDFLELLNVQPDDKMIEIDAGGAEFAMLLAYFFEDIMLTVHNRWQDFHFQALDRMDRYPNVNNGNVIDFIYNEDNGLIVKNERWDKIIVRSKSFISFLPVQRLNTFHDNLNNNGFLFLWHSVEEDECPKAPSRQKILKTIGRAKFTLVDEKKIGCTTVFKFKSEKESN